MSRTDEIDKIVDEIGDADSLYEFAEGIYEDRQRISELEEQLKNATKQVRKEVVEEIKKFANSIFTRYEKRELDDVAYGELLCCNVLIKKLGGVKRENNVQD